MNSLYFKQAPPILSNEPTQTISSMQIADITGKKHSNVMRDIRVLLDQGVSEFNFELSSYRQPQPNGGYKNVPCYNLTKKGCMILASGYNPLLREKIIDRWYELENEKRQSGFMIPQSFSDALLLAASQAKQIEQQQEQIKLQAPKVSFANAIISSNTSCLIGELAKILAQNGIQIGQNRLFKWMRNNGYLGKKGERYNIPNQQFIEQGLFELKKGVRSGNNGVLHTTITPKVTAKGQQYFINKFISI